MAGKAWHAASVRVGIKPKHVSVALALALPLTIVFAGLGVDLSLLATVGLLAGAALMVPTVRSASPVRVRR